MPADPQLNIISGSLWRLFIEPWWMVKGAARVVKATYRFTTSTIPQRIITIERGSFEVIPAARVTEIIVPNVWWCRWNRVVGAKTVTARPIMSNQFITSCNECPDVLPRGSMCNTNSADIGTI